MKSLIPVLSIGLLCCCAVPVLGVVHTVEVGDFAFTPAEITIRPLDTVRWVHVSGLHTVTADPESPTPFASGDLTTPGQTFEVVFSYDDGPGPFTYHCDYHPSMTGTISTADTCYASFDVNGDGIVLSVGDLVHLMRYLQGEDSLFPVQPYEADFNGDCVIDDGDLEIMNCYLLYGMVCVAPWYPVPTCCYPDTVVGACCFGADSCSIRSEANCASLGGEYLGDFSDCSDAPCDCCIGVRGDANGDGTANPNISDVTFLVAYLFQGGPEPPCFEEADANGDGTVNIDDIAGRLIPFLFQGGQPPEPCPGD